MCEVHSAPEMKFVTTGLKKDPSSYYNPSRFQAKRFRKQLHYLDFDNVLIYVFWSEILTQNSCGALLGHVSCVL